jgi:two-component system cell cycle sensor histidine kinase/response regulator CckA
MESFHWRFLSFTKSQNENKSENIPILIFGFNGKNTCFSISVAVLKNDKVRITIAARSNLQRRSTVTKIRSKKQNKTVCQKIGHNADVIRSKHWVFRKEWIMLPDLTVHRSRVIMKALEGKKVVRVLHLEDNENDRFLVEEMVRADGLDCTFTAVQTRGDFETALHQGGYDLILSDYSMPAFDGLSGLAIAHELSPKTPFIFFSGTIGEDSAVKSLKNGAVDYVIKQRPHRLVPAIRQALRNVQEHALLQQTEEKNREQAELLDKATDAILVCDLNNRIVYWNQSAERIYGWTAVEAIGRDIMELLFHGKPSPQIQEVIKSVDKRDEWTGELQELAKDGRPIIVQCRATLIRDKNRQPKSLLFINTDITEHKQLEEQFLRSQRLESLGVLISGIAHDLNNALTPVLIGIDILQGSPAKKENILKTMQSSARRGADMVKQVLAFARGDDTHKTLVHADPLVKEMGKIVSDTFPKNINCRVKVNKESWPVSAIPTQLYQVLMNLCVNARDAMPEGGTLALAVENVRLDDTMTARHPEAKPGNYVCVSVSDTGTGISAEQVGKIFQPFFTTKAPGKGTGLGLSTSLSIIKNHDGFMDVRSNVGQGTEFKFYLPALVEGSLAATPQKPSLPIGNGERILVVDDEAIVLVIARTALENYGYQVLTAASGLEAITCLAEKRDAVDAVITDSTMPLMGGAATAIALRRINPDVKIILAGDSAKEADDIRDRVKVDAFISKPFTVEKLLTSLHQVLALK